MDLNRVASTGFTKFLEKSELLIAEEKMDFGLLKHSFRSVYGRWPKGVDGVQKPPVEKN